MQVQNQRQRFIVAENDFETSKLELARAIGLPVSQPLTLTDKIPYAPMPDVNLETALTRAYAQRTDYLAAQERVKAAEAEQRGRERRAACRRSALDADYGTIGQSAGNAHPTYRIAANVRVPIFEAGKATARRAETSAELARRQAELADFSGRVDFEVRNACSTCAPPASDSRPRRRTRRLPRRSSSRPAIASPPASPATSRSRRRRTPVASASENYIDALYAHNLAKAMLARAVGTAEESVMTFLGGSK